MCGRCSHRWVVLILGLVFVLVNLLFWTIAGLRLDSDSPTYLRGAELLLQGQAFAGRPGLWLTYESVIAVCQLVGLGLGGVVAVQFVVAALAAVAQYDLAAGLYNRGAGLIAAGLLVANPDISRYHTHILTDSLYTSVVILAVWSIHRAAERQRGWYVLAAIVLLGAGLLRPEGWLLLPIAGAYWTIRVVPSTRIRLLATCGMLIVWGVGLSSTSHVRSGVTFEDPVQFLSRGDIVSGYLDWTLPMPARPEPVDWGMSDALDYVIRYPVESALLGVVRVGAELIHVRPFYSARHNAGILVYLLPIYALAILGLTTVRNESLAGLLLVVIMASLLDAAGIGANWDGRYLLFILPLICIFAAGGASWALSQCQSRRMPWSRRTCRTSPAGEPG